MILITEQTPTQSTQSTSTATPTVSPRLTIDSLSLQCNEEEGFYLYITEEGYNSSINNTCQAHCSEWNILDGLIVLIADDVVVLFFTSIGIIGSIAVIIFSIIRKERM